MRSFDQLAEAAARHAARPWFFTVVTLAILAWLPTVAVWDTGPSDLLVDALTNPLSLILLVLLQNSQYRSDRAADSRQDALEHAMALLLRHHADTETDDERRRALQDTARQLVANAKRSTSMAAAEVPR